MGIFKAYPTDLAVVCLAAIAAAIGVGVLSPGSTVRALVVAPLALLLPGYAFVSLLFPRSTESELMGELGSVTRIALAFATSLAILPLTIVAVGMVAPLSVFTIVESLVLFTIIVAQMATVRRLRQPSDTQYQPFHPVGVKQISSRLASRGSTTSKISAIFIAVAVLVAMSTAAIALTQPSGDADFTNFYLASENDDGELQTAGYPTNLTTGTSTPMVAVVSNEGNTLQEYNIVVQLQRVEDGAVVERSELARLSNTTPTGDQWRQRHDITPSMTGENLRLRYLLYTDDVPERPSKANADDHLHLWVDVSDVSDD